ncbi:hypothetical protein BDW22DRAFT_1339161 [Trametopsis cervina]|nr:hypothetical protein BDW22DRAFT_1339161 [Trametopsis cervina]
MEDLYASGNASEPIPLKALRWDAVNWSCAYDAFLNLMWNLWVQRGQQWFEQVLVHSIEMHNLAGLFAQVDLGIYPLETVRSTVRERLTLSDPQMFPNVGHVSIAVDNVFSAFLPSSFPSLFLTRAFLNCMNCGITSAAVHNVACPVIWESQAIEDSASRQASPLGMSGILSDLLQYAFSIRCTACRHPVASHVTFSDVPPLFIVNLNRRTTNHVPFNIERSLVIPTTGHTQRVLSLFGIVYWGANHFTTWVIDVNGDVWYNDSAISSMGSQYKRIGSVETVRLDQCEGRMPRIIMYRA